ncbi:elongation factor P 5-aminopentanone reductase [Piscibacillus halophilus]|uniref:3-oxoacyl-[acyl-carrier protein] reductase n=1 Tax=Piscibacillus halophilus TaxID=571933 RepID=A0A1H8Z4L4_9BACI|nr:SDR family oxidoreductase [Piscibacillus halophilus]SEP59293.1 3-oxoacyl-[acyl-carrier protein] reductase [Piscibacillus halophilus]
MKQTVLIVGASGEIGQAVAREFASHPYQFILHYNQNKEAIDQLMNELGEDQVLMTIQADLSQPSVDQMMMSIPFQVDIIIFAQGEAHYGLLTETSSNTIDKLYNIHVKSTIEIVKLYLPRMIKMKNGKIIIVTSIWGEIGASHEVIYSTMKGAQTSFVKALAKEVGQSEIQVNAVSPGIIQTRMNQHLTDHELQEFLTDVPLGKMGTVQDVAKAVLFLCSPDASYIQGQVIRVNGGQLS